MSTARLETFEASLERLDVTHDRTTAPGLADAVRDAVERPAVGAPLPWEDLALDWTGLNLDPTPADLRRAETGVTAAGAAIAAEGSLLIQARPGGDEPVSVYPPRHVAVLRGSCIVDGVPAAIEWLAGEFAEGRTSAVLATGPSATSDMGELVVGAHGPRTVHVVTVTDR